MLRVLVCNPITDATFTDLSERLGAGLSVTPTQLEAQLRESYPRAVVRCRQLAGETDETWYVYREGSWVPPDPT